MLLFCAGAFGKFLCSFVRVRVRVRNENVNVLTRPDNVIARVRLAY
jgi:hypothetical protein